MFIVNYGNTGANYTENILSLLLLLAVQGISAIGVFVLPALFFQMKERRIAGIEYFSFKRKPYWLLLMLTAVLLFVANPVLDWSMQWNKAMHFPEFLKGLEQWMRIQEDYAAEITRKFLTIQSVPEFLLAVLVIGILPALGEELLFRGCLMNIFIRMTKNVHIGIILSAIVFSAIHFQFFGFVPRMLLGMLFGYIFYFSGNIYYSMLAHFLNNTVVVVYAYYLQLNGESLIKLEVTEPVNVMMVVSSILFSGITLFYFQQLTKNKKQKEIMSNE